MSFGGVGIGVVGAVIVARAAMRVARSSMSLVRSIESGLVSVSAEVLVDIGEGLVVAGA